MHITRFTDLSLRVLMFLSVRDSAELATVNEIAEKIGWTRNHVVKVVHRLSQEGWIITQRGRSGGLSIAPSAKDLKLGDIVRRLEGEDPLIDCSEPPCSLLGACRLPRVLREAQEAFYDSLNRQTLGSLYEGLPQRRFSGEAVIPIGIAENSSLRQQS